MWGYNSFPKFSKSKFYIILQGEKVRFGIFKTRKLEDLARKDDGQKQLGKYFQRAQVMEYYKILSIVLTDDISFEDITNKIAIAFNIKLQTVNDDGRLLSVGETEKYKVIVIDRYDDLSYLLCDENHTLDIKVHKDIFQKTKILEEEIISILKCNKISWERGIWAPWAPGDITNGYREIFPEN